MNMVLVSGLMKDSSNLYCFDSKGKTLLKIGKTKEQTSIDFKPSEFPLF